MARNDVLDLVMVDGVSNFFLFDLKLGANNHLLKTPITMKLIHPEGNWPPMISFRCKPYSLPDFS